jgi:Ala-tRNA(Pro) deacylase
MPATRQDLFRRLAELQIETRTVEHEPLFTVAQSSKLERELPGAHTKNLFLKDEDGKLFLIVAASTTRIDLKALARTLHAGRFSFGKPELLMPACHRGRSRPSPSSTTWPAVCMSSSTPS